MVELSSTVQLNQNLIDYVKVCMLIILSHGLSIFSFLEGGGKIFAYVSCIIAMCFIIEKNFSMFTISSSLKIK